MASNTTRNNWIEKGYEEFANYGPEKLSINKISKEIDSSRASFYHHFGDLDVFIEEVLEYYFSELVEYTKVGEANCKNLFPDLYSFLSQNTIILKFSRQLFLNRHIPNYEVFFRKAFLSPSLKFMFNLFVAQYKLDVSDENALRLWLTVSESWYSRIDPNDLSEASLLIIAEDVLKSVGTLTSENIYNKI